MDTQLTDAQLAWTASFTKIDPRLTMLSSDDDLPPAVNPSAADPGTPQATSTPTVPPSANGAATPPTAGGAPAPADQPARAKYEPPPQSSQPTLRKGDESPDGWVEYLQELLKISVTGKFDAATEKAVIAYQSSHGCQPDGVVGNQTWAALRHAKKEAVGTDGRDPHSFEQKGVQARFFTEDKYVVYDKTNDSVSFIIDSVGDVTEIAKYKATFRITPPGGSAAVTAIPIGAPTQKSPTGQGNRHTVTIEKLKATYPVEACAEGNYKIEAYLDGELGGDRWSGEVLDKAPAPKPQPHGGPPKPKVTVLPEITVHGNVPIDVTITALNYDSAPLSGYDISVVFNASSEDRVGCAGTLQMGSTTISGVQVPPSGSVFFLAVSGSVNIKGATNYKRSGTDPIRFRAVQTKKTKTITATSGKEASDKVGATGTAGVEFKIFSFGVEVNYEHEWKTSSSEATQYTVEWGGDTWAVFVQE